MYSAKSDRPQSTGALAFLADYEPNLRPNSGRSLGHRCLSSSNASSGRIPILIILLRPFCRVS